MTDVTPTPEPKSGWNTLSKNAKVGVIVGGIVLLIIVIAAFSGKNHNNNGNGNGNSTTSTQASGPTPSQQWSDWKSSFQPAFSQFRSDYTTTIADLGNADVSASNSDFSTLAQDASTLNGLATSPDSTINGDVQQLANDVQNLSDEGLQSITNIQNGGSMTQGFSDASTAVGNDLTQLSTDLGNANSTY